MCAELGGDGMIRRRLLSELGMEEDEVKEWQTIVDMVTEGELSGSGGAFIFTTMPDGTPIQGHGFREIAVYYDCKANSEGTTSGFIRLVITDVNGTIANAQLSAGLPATGYRRGYFEAKIGNLFTIFNVQSSTNTSMRYSDYYDDNIALDEIKQIQFVSYVNFGVGTKIKIIGR